MNAVSEYRSQNDENQLCAIDEKLISDKHWQCGIPRDKQSKLNWKHGSNQ
jgi:hypothetical protein